MQPGEGGRGGGGGAVLVDVIDWLKKPGGQNVLVELVCSTKECNIWNLAEQRWLKAASIWMEVFFC